jgi:hypothetical protein
MLELLSRTAVPRRVTAPHALASFAAVVHRHTGQDDVTIDCHVSGDGTAGTGVVTVEPGDDPSSSVLADRTTAALDELPEASSAPLPAAITAIGWSRDFEAPFRSMGRQADCGTTDFEVLEDEHCTFTAAHATPLGVFSAGLLPTAAEHLR